MTIDDKKQWLGRYREAEERIQSLELELRTWYERAESITKPLSDMPQGGKGKNPLEEAVLHIWEIGEEINTEIVQMQQVRREIKEVINSVEDSRCRSVLRFIYLNFEHLERVANQVGYCERHVKRYYNRALELVEIPEKSKDVPKCH